MKILIIPDSFKGSASNVVVANSIAEGVRKVLPDAECILRPLADGGEGSLETIRLSIGGDLVSVPTLDPLGKPITGHFLRVGKTAYIELANASGLQLISESELSARKTSTIGTGLVIKAALEETIEELVLCIGGSATNDGGCGIAEALGYRFVNALGHDFLPVGNTLYEIRHIIPPARLPAVKFSVLCDVRNPFTGIQGATFVYGPQKGASSSDLDHLEAGMVHLRDIIKEWKEIDLDQIEGAGAAGGVGGGMMAFFNASLISGVSYLLEKLQIEKEVEGCDLIITGEGKIDQQTKDGKLISGITRLAKVYRKPVVGICGVLVLTLEETRALGLSAAFSILSRITSEEEAMKQTASQIRETSGQIVSLINTFRHE